MIRAVKLSDIENLSLLFNAYRVFYEKPSDIEQAKVFLTDRITKNESVIYISENEDSVMNGFVQLYPLFSSTRMRRLWLLNDLFVSEKYRGKGISIQLIEKAKSLCLDTDACGLILETAKKNKIGNQLYPKVGFELDNDHNYYSWDS
ncbi:MAG: GNAT family N-acetyltransferase [Leptospira sp.]|nr:GNAT family N-acetyltransferase [Leptospira sp.]